MPPPPPPSLLDRVRLGWAASGPARRATFLAAATLALVLTGLAAPPAYRWAKGARAAHLVSGLSGARDEASLLRAVQDAHAAYQLAPHHPKVIRAMAELYAAINTERSAGFWQALIRHPQATTDDHRAFVRAMLAFQRPEAAAPVLAALLEKFPEDAELIRLQAAWHQARGDAAAAAATLQALTSRHPEDAAAALALAGLRVQSGTEAAALEAKALLLRAMQDNGRDGLAALELLARRFQLTSDEAGRVADRLQTHPLAGSQRRLWLVELELRRQPERRERLINSVVAGHRGASPADQAQAARWLNQQGASAAVVELIPPDRAFSRQDLFLIWADSLALQKQWAELKRALEDPRAPIDRELALLFRARAARELGDDREAGLLWDRAAAEAAARPELLWYMARYAERLGESARAAQIYQTLARTQPEPRQAWLSLLRLHEASGDTPALIGVLAAMAERYPQDTAIRNDLAYLRLLTGTESATASAEALARLETGPRIMAYRITAALALLRGGDPAAALHILENSGIPDWSQLQPGWQAVRAATLGATGQHGQARQAARAIPAARLKPEEAALIQVWR